MSELILFLIALLHAALLAGGTAFVCKRLKLPVRDWPFAYYIIVWAALVLAGHIASILKALNMLEVYIPASFVALALMLGLFSYTRTLKTAAPLLKAPSLAFTPLSHLKARKFLKWFLFLTLGFAILSVVILAVSVYPDNADSMIYRLPRAFWYVSNGSFLHPFDSLDKRITYYPLDGVALYVPFVLYKLPGIFHNFPSLVSWGMVAYTTYRFARDLGAERLIAFFATWLVILTPSILAQSISTNDEILAATAFLTSLYMGWRWLLTGGKHYFFLAATAIGLSAGTKLHVVFLMPTIFVALGIAAWHAYKNPSLLRKWANAIGGRAAIISLLMTALMFAPFLFYNYFSTGRFYFTDEFAKDVFNLNASLSGALQNLLIYLSQMVISPIADLNFWPVANDRQQFNTALNAIFTPLIKPLLNEDPSFYHLSYRFVGITLPVSVRFVEFSLWSAFVWMLWPWQATLAFKQKFPLRNLFFLIALTPPLWLLFWSFTTLYMEGTATYFTYYLVCAAPAAVFVFAPIKKAAWNEIRWITILVVMVTSFVISTNMLMYSGFRALPDLYYARSWPYDWVLMDETITKEIRAAEKVRIIATHEKMPYFAYMHRNPMATYYSPFSIEMRPDIEKILQILPISSNAMYGFMPLKIPNKATRGTTYLGTMRGIGREAIFAVGNGVHLRYPTESDYILPHITITPEEDGYLLAMDDNIAGLNADDRLEFSYELLRGQEVFFTRDWDKNPSFKVKLREDPNKANYSLTLIVRSAWSNKELTRKNYKVGGQSAWLPEDREY